MKIVVLLVHVTLAMHCPHSLVQETKHGKHPMFCSSSTANPTSISMHGSDPLAGMRCTADKAPKQRNSAAFHCPNSVQVVERNQEFDGGMVALSSFGFGGSNMHMVMEGDGSRGRVIAAADTKVAPVAPGSLGDSAELVDNPVAITATPLAARTAEGLAYLARTVAEVRSPVYCRSLGCWSSKATRCAEGQ